MIPELSHANYTNEIISTGSEPMMVDQPLEAFCSKTQFESFTLSSMTSSYLHRIPSGSRQWEIYLEDLVESKTKRSRRVQRESESVNDFLQRFPIFEMS